MLVIGNLFQLVKLQQLSLIICLHEDMILKTESLHIFECCEKLSLCHHADSFVTTVFFLCKKYRHKRKKDS